MAGTGNPVRRFIEFFRRIDSVPSKRGDQPLQQRSLLVDWQHLADFDAELADQLLDHPDAAVGYAREALMMLGATRASVNELPQLRFRNLDTETDPEELAVVPIGQLVSVSGILEATTDVWPGLRQITVECQHCGTTTKGRYFGLTTPNVPSCRTCGREDNVPVTTESEIVDTQYGRLLVGNSTGDTHSETIHLRLDADLPAVTPGEPVQVTGVVRPCQRTELDEQSTIQTRFLHCSDIIPREIASEQTVRETSWTSGDLSTRPTFLAAIANAVAPSVSGFWRAKLILALLSVESTLFSSQSAERGLNILLLAPASEQRNRLLEAFSELNPETRHQSLTGAYDQPIVAEVEEVASNWWVETGTLVQAADGIAAIDGIEHSAETQQPFLRRALTRTQIRLAKAGIELSLDTCAHVVAAVTPTTNHPENLRAATPLDDDVFSAFDVHIADSAGVTMSRSTLISAWEDGTETVSHSDETRQQQPDTDVYRSALAHAQSLEQPHIDATAQQHLQASRIDYDVLEWIATALARLCGQRCVRPIDIDRAEHVSELLDMRNEICEYEER